MVHLTDKSESKRISGSHLVQPWMPKITNHTSEAMFEMAFRTWFGLSRARARVLVALWDAEGGTVPLSAINLDRRSLYVYISDLRTALDAGAIRTRSKVGYALTEIGLSECRTAIAYVRESSTDLDADRTMAA